MPDLIRPETHRRVISAVDSMVANYKGGMSPNDSLHKVATDYGFTPDQLRIVGRSFNTGQTLTEMQGEGSIASKTAGAHPLVDVEGVVRSVFSKESKAEVPADIIASIYKPRFRELAPVTTNKVASALPAKAEVQETTRLPWVNPEEFTEAGKMAYVMQLRRMIMGLDKAASMARTEVAVAKAAFTSALRDLVETRPHLVPYLRKDAATYQNESAVRIFDEALNKVLSPKLPSSIRKQATAAAGSIREIPMNPDHPLLVKLAACSKAGCDCGKKESNRMLGRIVTAKIQRMTNGQDSVPRAISSTNLTPEKKAEAYMDKFAFSSGAILTSGLMNMLGKNRSVDPSSTGFREAELNLADPEHEQSLRNIRIRASLQDLLDYDPVLQSYDPETVLAAFNDLSQAAPTSLENPIALQAGLRRVLQGDMALHESSQLGADEMQNRKLLTPLTAQVTSNGLKIPR